MLAAHRLAATTAFTSCQCLDRRVPDIATLGRDVAAWQERRNTAARPVDWRFTTQDARITLKRLYPSFQE